MLVNDPFASSEGLQAWRDTVFGEKEVVSQSNEAAVWRCIASICQLIIARAHEGLQALPPSTGEALPEWHSYAVECIRQLWLEELRVAEAVIQTIKSGEV